MDLKAALYRKQQEFKREKGNQAGSDSTLPVTRKVSDKVCKIPDLSYVQVVQYMYLEYPIRTHVQYSGHMVIIIREV